MLQVHGIPPYVSTKTLFSHQSRGFGIPFLPVLQPTRLLNTVHKASAYCVWNWLPTTCDFRPSALFQSARASLYGPHTQRPLPFLPIPHGMEPCPSVFGLEVYRSKYPSPSLVDGHSDGSFHPKANESASAAACPDGYAYMARTPGRQGIYKAEVIGVLLDAHYSPPRTPLFTDNQGVSKVVNHTKQVLNEAYWIGLARAELKAKGSTLQWEKAHAQIRGNEIADDFANRGTKLPLPTGFSRSFRPWEICINGEPFLPPHKVWTHDLIPSHRPRHIHTTTYPPLKRSILVWYSWHFALVWRPGYSAPTTFWRDTPPKRPCQLCKGSHNQSVHGYVAYCLTHPLHLAWRAAWGPNSPALSWRAYAQRRDAFLTGKLAIPDSLYAHMSRHLGKKGALKAIASFQDKVIELLHAALPPIPQDYKTPRPSPYNIADWDITRAPPPSRRRNLSLTD